MDERVYSFVPRYIMVVVVIRRCLSILDESGWRTHQVFPVEFLCSMNRCAALVPMSMICEHFCRAKRAG